MVWPIGQPRGVLYQRALSSRKIWKDICVEANIWHSDETGSFAAGWWSVRFLLTVLGMFSHLFRQCIWCHLRLCVNAARLDRQCQPCRCCWTGAAGGLAPECTGGYAAIDDDITQELPIGFNFTFGATTYSQLRIMSNGRLQFSNPYCYYGTQTVGPPPTYTVPYPNGNLNNTDARLWRRFLPGWRWGGL